MSTSTNPPHPRRKLIPEMEGVSARSYARLRGSPSQLAEYRQEAARLAAGLPPGAHVLEVAPGPGYHAIELARDRELHVTGLDVSRSMVQIARERAAAEGVDVRFEHGDVAGMPFDADSFDLIICQAAFKNFTEPVRALDEMHRVLRPGGAAVIQDLRKDTPGSEIDAEVRRMRVGAVSALMTRVVLRLLRRRAYTVAAFEQLAARSAFGTCAIDASGVGLEARLVKRVAA